MRCGPMQQRAAGRTVAVRHAARSHCPAPQRRRRRHRGRQRQRAARRLDRALRHEQHAARQRSPQVDREAGRTRRRQEPEVVRAQRHEQPVLVRVGHVDDHELPPDAEPRASARLAVQRVRDRAARLRRAREREDRIGQRRLDEGSLDLRHVAAAARVVALTDRRRTREAQRRAQRDEHAVPGLAVLDAVVARALQPADDHVHPQPADDHIRRRANAQARAAVVRVEVRADPRSGLRRSAVAAAQRRAADPHDAPPFATTPSPPRPGGHLVEVVGARDPRPALELHCDSSARPERPRCRGSAASYDPAPTSTRPRRAGGRRRS